MRRLFFKIFMWFWLAILVVSATLVASTALTFSRPRGGRDVGPREMGLAWTCGPSRKPMCSSAKKVYRELFEDVRSLLRWKADPTRLAFEATRSTLRGREILGREVPPQVVQALRGNPRDFSRWSHQFLTQQRIIGEKIAGPSGRSYVMIAAYPLPPAVPRPLSCNSCSGPSTGRGILRLVAVLARGRALLLLARCATSRARSRNSVWRQARLRTRATSETRVDAEVVARGDELGELGRDFDRMAARINALVTAERRLLADVSHTLRSPLARLNVALGLARRQADAGTTEHLERIEREADLLNRLIGHVLTMARVESGIDLQQKKVFDLGALLEEVAADGDYTKPRGRKLRRVKFLLPSRAWWKARPKCCATPSRTSCATRCATRRRARMWRSLWSRRDAWPQSARGDGGT